MESIKTGAAEAAPATEEQRYAMGMIRRAIRIVAAVVLLPLLIWQAARAYGHRASDPTEAASATAMKVTVVSGSATALGSGLSVSEWVMLGGLLFTALSLAVQVWLGRRKDLREELRRAEERAEHEARMREHEARMSELHE